MTYLIKNGTRIITTIEAANIDEAKKIARDAGYSRYEFNGKPVKVSIVAQD